MPNFYKQLFWGPIFDFHDFQKAPLGYHFRPQRLPNVPVNPGSRDPAFHKTRVIIVPLGPTGFFKGRLLVQD